MIIQTYKNFSTGEIKTETFYTDNPTISVELSIKGFKVIETIFISEEQLRQLENMKRR